MKKYILSIIFLGLLTHTADAGSRYVGSREWAGSDRAARRFLGYSPDWRALHMIVEGGLTKEQIFALILQPTKYFDDGSARSKAIAWAADPVFLADMKGYAARKKAEEDAPAIAARAQAEAEAQAERDRLTALAAETAARVEAERLAEMARVEAARVLREQQAAAALAEQQRLAAIEAERVAAALAEQQRLEAERQEEQARLAAEAARVLAEQQAAAETRARAEAAQEVARREEERMAREAAVRGEKALIRLQAMQRGKIAKGELTRLKAETAARAEAEHATARDLLRTPPRRPSDVSDSASPDTASDEGTPESGSVSVGSSSSRTPSEDRISLAAASPSTGTSPVSPAVRYHHVGSTRVLSGSGGGGAAAAAAATREDDVYRVNSLFLGRSDTARAAILAEEAAKATGKANVMFPVKLSPYAKAAQAARKAQAAKDAVREEVARVETVKKWLRLKAQAENVIFPPERLETAINTIAEASKGTKDPVVQFFVIASIPMLELLNRGDPLFARTVMDASDIAPNSVAVAGSGGVQVNAREVLNRRAQIIRSLFTKFISDADGAPLILNSAYFREVVAKGLVVWERTPEALGRIVISTPWDELFYDIGVFREHAVAVGGAGGRDRDDRVSKKDMPAKDVPYADRWDGPACLRVLWIMDLLRERGATLPLETQSRIIDAVARAHGRTGPDIETIFNAHTLGEMETDPNLFVAAGTSPMAPAALPPLKQDTMESFDRVSGVMNWVRSHLGSRTIFPEIMRDIERTALEARNRSWAELSTLLRDRDTSPAFFETFLANYRVFLAPRDEKVAAAMGSDGGSGGAGGLAVGKGKDYLDKANGGAGDTGMEKVVLTTVAAGSPGEAADIAVAMVASLERTATPSPLPDRTDPSETVPGLDDVGRERILPATAGTGALLGVAAPTTTPAVPVHGVSSSDDGDPIAPDSVVTAMVNAARNAVGGAVDAVVQAVSVVTGGRLGTSAPVIEPAPEPVAVPSAAARGVVPEDLSAAVHTRSAGGILPTLDATDRDGCR